MRHMHSDKSIGAAMLRSVAWFAFGAPLIGATILADVAFDLVFLEGDIRRDGGATNILIVVVASTLTMIGLLLCVLAAWRAISSLVLGALGGR